MLEKRNTYFWGLFRMALKSRNETGNQLRIYVSFHVKRTRWALGMFLFPFMKRNNEIRNVRSKFPPIELELIQTQMAQKPMLRAEVGMRVRCANKASAE